MIDRERTRRAVLIGAGHAHLEMIRNAGEFVRRGFEIVLIAPDHFWYSGLATGMLGGQYPEELDQVDVERLVQREGGRFLRACATSIDPATRTVSLDHGEPITYDVLSLNVGSEIPVDTIPGLAAHGVSVKPIRALRDLRDDLINRFSSSRDGSPIRIVVVGGGATGCEVAACLRRLAETNHGNAEILMLVRGADILPRFSARARGIAVNALGDRDVRIVQNAEVARVEPGQTVLADGRRLPFDVLISAIGLVPPPLVGALGLPTDARGALIVNEYLHSIADPRVFGGGDCVALQGHDLARIGVYAIRQAGVLRHNMLSTLTGDPPRHFQPQRNYLLVMNLGDGTGLATWSSLAWRGKAAFWLKDRIDRRFLRKYRV